MLNGLKGAYLAQSFDAATASTKALATLYGSLREHAGALSFESAFGLMSAMVACLVPLPFLMRRPKARSKSRSQFIKEIDIFPQPRAFADFHTFVLPRMIEVMFMPLIVISISTLNDIGGSVCNSLLAVCLARWN